MQNLLWVGMGGFLGANARYLMTLWINEFVIKRAGQLPTWVMFPYGTLVVNVLGSFGLAIFGVWFGSRVGVSPNVKLLVGTGFFGAFTTFSTFANESLVLAQDGNWMPFILNVLVTNGLCLLGVVLGLMVAGRLFGG